MRMPFTFKIVLFICNAVNGGYPYDAVFQMTRETVEDFCIGCRPRSVNRSYRENHFCQSSGVVESIRYTRNVINSHFFLHNITKCLLETSCSVSLEETRLRNRYSTHPVTIHIKPAH